MINMETPANIYHIEIDRKKYEETKIGDAVIKRDYGFHIEAEETINLKYFNYYSGWVRVSPRRIHGHFKYDDPVKPGTYVYFHHFVLDNEIGSVLEDYVDVNKLNWAQHTDIFCKVEDGVIKPREGKVLIKPIWDKEEDLYQNGIKIKANPEIIHERGILSYVPENEHELKENIGKTVIFKEECEYKIEIEGEEYYVMDVSDVLSVLE